MFRKSGETWGTPHYLCNQARGRCGCVLLHASLDFEVRGSRMVL